MEDDTECASLPKLTELEDDAEYASFPKPTELENDAECASLLKLTELVKKPSNLTKTGKKKFHCPISHFLAHFVEPIGRLSFCFVKGLTGLIDDLAMGEAESRGKKVAVSFSG